ncbi:hexokinase-2, chloroplastic isoform X2 [Vigna radiata var. radiata]|uniref:Phosphotransferase n=1 Tax=Vigna radiata var. radiata TaxID=3916 RepID=A0A3Q0F7F4_VIGRR|nr:hexokinase-2, chloroplastic isoform X2 [Vigna radiata var. radiata]
MLSQGMRKGCSMPWILVEQTYGVVRVQLGGKDERVIDTEFDQVSVPQDLMSATSEELFDFIASGLAKFVSKEDGRFHISPGRKREIGFTFSFPVKQTSIDSGILIKWTKGFAVSGTAESNLSERKTVLEVCETVVRRGGRLAGAGIVGILQKMEEDENRSVVAIDGGLYENYPQYRTYLQDSVEELLGTEKSNNVVIEHTKDGSAIGAALLAASNSIYQQHL